MLASELLFICNILKQSTVVGANGQDGVSVLVRAEMEVRSKPELVPILLQLGVDRVVKDLRPNQRPAIHRIAVNI